MQRKAARRSFCGAASQAHRNHSPPLEEHTKGVGPRIRSARSLTPFWPIPRSECPLRALTDVGLEMENRLNSSRRQRECRLRTGLACRLRNRESKDPGKGWVRQEKRPCSWLQGPQKERRRPTFPHSLPCSIIGAGGLNFCVRNGNRWNPSAKATANCKRSISANLEGWAGKPARGSFSFSEKISWSSLTAD